MADDNSKTIVVEDFSNPTNKWKTLNDPVMGGKSYSSLSIDGGVAKFTGKCAIVPSLQAPGFITMETGGQFGERAAKIPDVSTCSGFEFQLKTNTDYAGYRVSFGKAHPKGGRFAYGYKAPLPMDILPSVGEFGSVTIPFNQFSDKWDDATGEILVTCADDPQYCPSSKWLKSMETISFWGEGVEGMVDLEIQSISAIGCDADASENAMAPPMITANMHTINSNPFFMGAFIITSVLAGLVIMGCYCCICRGRFCFRRNNDKDTTQRTALTGTFKDSMLEDFDDVEDLELDKEKEII
mmetsp:Transcript_30536/g.34819  ORF Transcript_30536/g.34819 Transcript_30536/m.34819 type:complete len:297 (-) Transcript_30536:220-1110(-)